MGIETASLVSTMWAVKQRIAIVMLPKPVKTEVDEKRVHCCDCDRAEKR